MNFNSLPFTAKQISFLIYAVDKKIITEKDAVKLLDDIYICDNFNDVENLIKSKDYNINNNYNLDELNNIIIDILNNNIKDVQDYKNGNKKVIGFLMGKILKLCDKNIDKKIVNKILIERLENA